MRHSGDCFEIVGMRPHDHIGWVFGGAGAFDGLARRFLIEGAERGERLMFVAEDPDPEVVDGIVDDPDALQVASIAEVYGASGVVDPASQRATFADALREALSAGYRGIRVAADNTPLVLDAERLTA